MGARSGGRAIALQVFFALDADGSLDEGARDRIDVDAVLGTGAPPDSEKWRT